VINFQKEFYQIAYFSSLFFFLLLLYLFAIRCQQQKHGRHRCCFLCIIGIIIIRNETISLLVFFLFSSNVYNVFFSNVEKRKKTKAEISLID